MERKGILGRKLGMTQVFAKNGKLIPVTVVEVEPNVVTQIKTVETDGYEAIQLGFDTKREKSVKFAKVDPDEINELYNLSSALILNAAFELKV